jgi:hypothetical protein
VATHGIKAARFRDAGSSGSYTQITALGDASEVTFEDPEGVKPPAGGSYYGGRKTMAKIETLDATAFAAAETKYKANGRIELQVDLDDTSQQTVTGHVRAVPQNVKGASGGARGYEITVHGFAI